MDWSNSFKKRAHPTAAKPNSNPTSWPSPLQTAIGGAQTVPPLGPTARATGPSSSSASLNSNRQTIISQLATWPADSSRQTSRPTNPTLGVSQTPSTIPSHKGDLALSVHTQLHSVNTEIGRLQNSIRSNERQIERNRQELAELTKDPRMTGHWQDPIRRVQQRIRNNEQTIQEAKQALSQRKAEKKELEAQWKQEEKEKKEKDRLQKIKANRQDFQYKGTARDTSTSAAKNSPILSKASAFKSDVAQKRKRDSSSSERNSEEALGTKKAKVDHGSSAITEQQLSSLPPSQKGAKPSSEDTGPPRKAPKRKRAPSNPAERDDMPSSKRSKTTAKKATLTVKSRPLQAPESKMSAGGASNENKKGSPTQSTSAKAKTSSTSKNISSSESSKTESKDDKKSSTPPSSPTCEEDEEIQPCGFKRLFDSFGDLDFMEHQLNCNMCKGESSPMEPKGLLNLNDASAFTSALQLLNAALTDDHVASILDDGVSESFGLDEADCASYVNGIRDPEENAAFEQKLSQAREQVAEAMKNKAPRLGPYIGQTLLNLRGLQDEVTAIVAMTVFEVMAGRSFNEPAGCLQKIMTILGEENRSLLEIFAHKFGSTTRCSSYKCGRTAKASSKLKLRLSLEAEEPEMRMIQEDGEEMEEEMNPTLVSLLGTAMSCTSEPDRCHLCKQPAQTTQELNKYPERLVVAIDRSSSVVEVELSLGAIPVGEKEYVLDAVVQKEATGHFVALRQHDNAWWKLREEDVNSLKKFEVQDSVRSQWVLALLKQR